MVPVVSSINPGASSIVTAESGTSRCYWSGTSVEYRRYHDEEWGVPLRGDQPLFEKLSLEAFQSGLSWITILNRRPTFRRAFADFAIDAVAAFDDADVARLLLDEGIIRNRAKISATIANARIAQELIAGHPGAFDELLWSFAPTGPHARPVGRGDLVAVTAESTALSTALRGLGFRFVGPTTMHALMQSAGMIDDHLVGCWRAD